MLNYRIIEAYDPEWDNYLIKLPDKYQDINFTAGYHRMMEGIYNAKSQLFVAYEGDKIFYHPFIKREIKKYENICCEKNYYDIQSVFGYTGPVANTGDKHFIDKSNIIFEDYCSRNHIVAEFIRFNPLFQNQLLIKSNKLKIIKLKEFVIIDLSQSIEEIIKNYKHSLRTNLRASDRYSNWEWNVTNTFESCYEAGLLLKKRIAEKDIQMFYSLCDKYYKKLSDFIRTSGLVFEARDSATKEILAGEIFIFKHNTIYFLHSARNIDDYRSSILNIFLIHQAIIYFKKKGYKWFFMGGGVSNGVDDSLLRFKKKFSQNTQYYYIGKRIFDQDIYSELCSKWEIKHPDLKEMNKDVVLKYNDVY